MSNLELKVYEHILENVEIAVRRDKISVKMDIYEKAEQNAEVYVSSTLGFEKDSPNKYITKNKYIELFINLIKESI